MLVLGQLITTIGVTLGSGFGCGLLAGSYLEQIDALEV
jgi:hypothetical protein